jgi:hypothetical protein
MHAVNLQITARVPFDCAFWLDADGWTGVCEQMSLTVRGGSFEDAKKVLERALQEQVERIVREHFATSIRLSA